MTKIYLNEEVAKREPSLVQYRDDGNIKRPMPKIPPVKTQERLQPGLYNIGVDLQGPFLRIADIKTDELLRFDDPRYHTILNEVEKFWTLEDNFKKVGMTMKRGVLLHGSPGTGKSCLIKLLQEDAVSADNIVLISNDMYDLIHVLKSVKEIEPDRNVLVIMEDIDSQLGYSGEHKLLELFDGPDQQDKVCYVATTNYVDRLPERVLRSGRFDRKLEIMNPPKAGRLAYLQSKLGINEDEEKLNEIADKTDGFSFGDLREFVVSVFCLEYDEDETIARIKSGGREQGESRMAENLFKKRYGFTSVSESAIRQAVSGKKATKAWNVAETLAKAVSKD